MTEAAKRKQILGSERDHGTSAAPVPFATAVTVASLGNDPIDAPFHIMTAHRDKWFAPRGGTPTSVVIHCTAATNPASSTAAFFASSAPSGSTQAVADDVQGFACVPDDAVCAGAPPFNQEGLHIEQPGLVDWTRATWLSHIEQIRRVAYWTAQKCVKYQIPIRLMHAADLKTMGEKAKGITYHAAVSEAFKQSTHTDPGPNYPWDVFIPLVQQFADGGTTPPGGDDMAVLTDDEQYYLRGAMRYLNAFGPPDANAPAKVKEGFTETKARIEAGGGAAPVTNHKHVPGGVQSAAP